MSWQVSYTSGRLAPLSPDLPDERRALADALRAHFDLLFPTSVRGYARAQALQASTVTRYLRGAVLPSEDFINDLVDEIQLRLGRPQPGQPQRLLELLYAAQDAQSGTWGHSERLLKQNAGLRRRLETAELRYQHLLEENYALRQDQSSAVDALRPQLKAAVDRIAELEHARDVLLARLDGTQATALRPNDGRASGSYWPPYRNSLKTRGWSHAAVAGIESVVEEVFGKLAVASTQRPEQRRGAVVHDFQSGRTAAAIGLVAKAVDAGYRLVIVLAGNLNALRRQVQERLDGELSSTPGAPRIVSLTGQDFDYGQLGPRLRDLMFEKQRSDLPLNSPQNLPSAATRLLVVKKNSNVLRRLITDLRACSTPLGEIPALVIDLDTDLAQPYSAVERSLTTLLATLPRAQHIVYAPNSLFDPSIAERAEFLVCVPQLDGFLGPKDLYDDLPADKHALATSGENAFVRRVDHNDTGLLAAIDAFVLTGAMKIHRSQHLRSPYSRHILFVHADPRLREQDALRERVTALWRAADYADARGRTRLRQLFETDVLRVSRLRAPGMVLPSSFDELAPALTVALNRIGDEPTALSLGTGTDPMWKIVVSSARKEGTGGDGLTILHLHHTPGPNTLNRLFDLWFGFHPAYADLVRLYVPLTDPGSDFYADLVDFWRSNDQHRRSSDD